MLPYLKQGGRVVVNTHPIMPVTATLQGSAYTGQEMLDYLTSQVPDAVLLDGDAACREIGSPKVLNMIMLGAAVRCGVLPFTTDEIEGIMRRTVREQFHALNSRALHYQEKG